MKLLRSSKKAMLLALCMLSFLGLQAQQAGSDVEMADALRASGKIYVVVCVLMLIFIGIVAYLVALDRKVRKLEKYIRKK